MNIRRPRRIRHGVVAALLLLQVTSLTAPAAAAAPSRREAIPAPSSTKWSRQDLKTRVDALVQPVMDSGYAVGYAIGLIQGKETLILGYGRTARDSGRTPDGRTLFQVGSITKTFVGVQLADLARRNIVRVDDPIELYLPEFVSVPGWGERKITLLDLATHRSGLPGLPADFLTSPSTTALGGEYTMTQLLKWLSSYRLTRAPGERFEYSNVGIAILGHIVGNIQGKTWEQSCMDTICTPLGMKDTRTVLTPEQQSRLARGHRADLDPVPLEEIGVMGPGGSLISSVEDLSIYVRAHLALIDTPLRTAMDIAMAGHASAEPIGEMGLCWIRLIRPDTNVVFYVGDTFGYLAAVIFDLQKKTGVIVLGNQDSTVNQDLAFQLWALMDGRQVEPLKLRKAAEVAADSLIPYTGTYLVERSDDQRKESSDKTATVALYGEGLKVLLPGQFRARLFRESEDRFFLKGVSDAVATVAFIRDDKGRVGAMSIFYNGQTRVLKKIR